MCPLTMLEAHGDHTTFPELHGEILSLVYCCAERGLIYTLPFYCLQEDLSSSAMEIVEAKGLRQMTDKGKIETLCRGIVEDPKHEKQVRGFVEAGPFFSGWRVLDATCYERTSHGSTVVV